MPRDSILATESSFLRLKGGSRPSDLATRQKRGYITVPRSQLRLAPPGAGNVGNEESPIPVADVIDYAETLGTRLEPYLVDGYPPAELGARLMGTSVRTLARRLSECDVTYQRVIDRVRFNVAVRLLRDPDQRIADVALATGFRDASNFARMFRRVGGLTPQQFRRKVLASSGASDA